MKITRFLAALCVGYLMSMAAVGAQTSSPTSTTVPAPVKIGAGLTFQQLLPASSGSRQSITIENNNANTDNCLMLIVGKGSPWLVGDTTTTSRTVNGVSMTAAQAAITLAPVSGSYSRYYGYIPQEQILGTCASTGDSLYVDTQ